jgi:cell division protease FtsH
VRGVTSRAALMVGFRAMGPARMELADRIEDREERRLAELRVREHFQDIGYKIMNRAPGGLDSNQFANTLIDRAKRPLIAELIGQGFVVAYQTVVQNRQATERIADELVEKGELYGDDVTSLLDGVGLRKPKIDVLDEAIWPAI